MLIKKIHDMFSSPEGTSVYGRINSYILENNIRERLKDGVLVGFSGGPDSVMLLSFLYELLEREERFPIVCCHINHMIRGEDADADEAMAFKFSEALGVEFISKRIDVPRLSVERSLGTEECAREVRYSAFEEIIRGRKDIKYIVTAHNLGDSIETALFNILRGAGPLGASGIAPVRENILRPMLSVSKTDILSLLDKYEIPYSVDKTNFSSDYTRNFIRNEVLPKISERFPSYEHSVSRFCENMRDCYELVERTAQSFLSEHKVIKNTELLSLNSATLSEVLNILSELRVGRDTVLKIKALLKGDNFTYNLPLGRVFVCERGICSVRSADSLLPKSFRYDLKLGLNKFSEFSSLIYLSYEPLPETYSNIYKISIQDRIPFDIIDGEIYVRSREAGDTIFYNGITHKIKKMFCDRKIPNSKKDLIPVFCDNKGPLLVPGYHARGDVRAADKYLYVYVLDECYDTENRFFTGRDFV
jgi:tRNA(Ile)-lysidine synthase